MKKGILAFGLACVLAGTCLAACGKGGDDGDIGDLDAPITEDVTINFWGWGDEAEKKNYQTLVNQFMAEPGNEHITVVYTPTDSSTYMTTLTNSARNLPELFFMPDYDFLEWASSGLLKNISSAVTEEELSSIWPQAVDEYYFNPKTSKLGKSDGANLYGLPKDLGPFTFVYNQTLLDEQIGSGIEIGGRTYTKEEVYATFLNPKVPMSWNQLRDLLKAVTTEKVYGISHYEIEAAVYSNNANFFNDDASTQRITEKNFTDALQFIADLALVDRVMPSEQEQKEQDGFQRFMGKGCIFSFMGPWDSAQFWGRKVDFKMNVLPVAYGTAEGAKSTAWVGSMAYCVSGKASALQTQAALKLAKYLCLDEGAQRKFYQLGQQVPNLVEMAKGEYLKPDNELLMENGKVKDPVDRSVWVDTIAGENELIGGKVRARYYTYSSGWYNDFTQYLSEQGLLTGTTAASICSKYKTTFQAKLDEMRARL